MNDQNTETGLSPSQQNDYNQNQQQGYSPGQQNDYNQNQHGYSPGQQYHAPHSQYHQPYPPPPPFAPQWPHMRVGEWVASMLLMLIPIVNIVLVLVWAFGSSVNPSKKSFFQAYLILMAVSVLLSIVFTILLGAVFLAMFTAIIDSIQASF